MADLDTNEADFLAKDSGDLVGLTFDGAEAQLYDSIDCLTTDDADDDSVSRTNSGGQTNENLTYNGTSSAFDTVITYSTTITYIDGTTGTAEVIIAQDELGRVFLRAWEAGNTINDPLSLLPIESVILNTLTGASYSGTFNATENDAFIDGTVDGTSGNESMGTNYTDADGTQMNA